MSSFNIQGVNMLSSVSKFEEIRKRGIGKNKQMWAIEMNDTRRLYLKKYYVIDNIDHLLKNGRMSYQSHTYWHSPTIFGKSLATLIAYAIYLEFAERKVDELLKTEEQLSFWELYDWLSSQMCMYKPLDRLYTGDENKRVCV